MKCSDCIYWKNCLSFMFGSKEKIDTSICEECVKDINCGKNF